MLYFIPTPIGNLNDISQRALRILGECESVLCEDTRVCKSLLALLNAKFGTKIAPKRVLSLHSHNEKEVLASLVDYEVLSGANAALVAVAASGLCEKEFTFFGFLSNKGKERQKDIEKVLSNAYASVIYESPKRILALVSELARLCPQRELFAIKEISKKFEKKFKGEAKTLAKALENENLNGEWVLVVAGEKESEKAGEKKGIFLSKDEIMALNLGTKDKAKLLAKFETKQTKEIYHQLLSEI